MFNYRSNALTVLYLNVYFIATGENTPENAEATAMAVVEEDSPEIIRFQEFQNTPVSSAVIHIYYIFHK